MSPAKAAPAVRFEATPYAIDGPAILRLPEKASNQLPSRGQVAVQATVNGHACQTVAEPDGESGHWVRIDARQQRAAALRAGDTAEVDLVSLGDWPEPKVPRGSSGRARCGAGQDPGTVEGHHADGALGMASVGECDPESRNAPAPRRSQHLEDAEREAPAVLFQPGRVHRPGPFEERQADQSAMIHPAHAVSEPCGPREVSQG
jgi:hypothetical protein